MASTAFTTGTVITSTWLNSVDTLQQAEVTVASAATVDLQAQTSDKIKITGTTTITSFGTASSGIPVFLRFTGILTLTHNATTLVCPGNANIITAAGDCCLAVPISGGWQVYNYQRQATAP